MTELLAVIVVAAEMPWWVLALTALTVFALGATLVLTDAVITVGGTDLTDHCTRIEIEYEAEEVPDTHFADTARGVIAGLLAFRGSAVFSQDYAASNVDATLFAAIGTKSAFAAKPTSGAISTSNPEYQGTVLWRRYKPIDGQVGDKLETTLEFTGDGALTRDVVP